MNLYLDGFEIVLDVVCLMAKDIIKPSDPRFKEVLDKIRNDDRYWPYFKNCIGVIDGTHIPLWLLEIEKYHILVEKV